MDSYRLGDKHWGIMLCPICCHDISAAKVSETVYDVVTQKGMPIGGR